MARSLRGSGGTDDLVLLNIESQGRGVPHVHALSSEGSAEYLLKYLCKGAGSAMTAADEKYDDDVEMLDGAGFCGFSIVCAVKRETGEASSS